MIRLGRRKGRRKGLELWVPGKLVADM